MKVAPAYSVLYVTLNTKTCVPRHSNLSPKIGNIQLGFMYHNYARWRKQFEILPIQK